MRITIADRFKPFSHVPGTICVLPRSGISFQIYPEKVLVIDRDKTSSIKIDVQGPVKDFTVQLDLEKGCIRVWGKAPGGLLRYSIYPEEGPAGYRIIFDKEETPAIPEMNLERLSLGSNKAQDWELVRRRLDMTEILPQWFFLGQQIETFGRPPAEGTSALLHECRRAIIADDSRCFLEPFKWLYLTGFNNLWSPRNEDTEFQGFHLPEVTSDFTPKVLLSEGAALIKSLFFSYNDGVIDVLPALPVELHTGRFINLKCGTQGLLDMEWTKKSIRRLLFHSQENGAIRLSLPREIKQFRVRTSEEDRGQKVTGKTPIEVVAGGTYLIDRFEK